MVKVEFSHFIALKKTLKNLLITLTPFLTAWYLTNQAKLPEQYQLLISFLVSALSYYTKNWVENK